MLTPVQTAALVIFAATYAALIVGHKWKLPIVVVATAALLLWPGLLSFSNALHAVNWNVVMLYFGMLFVTETLILSGAPAVLAEKLIRPGTSATRAVLMVCIVSGFISTVVENVAVVLIVAPIALAVARRLKIQAAPMLIGVALCSNLQGAATMIGDPPSMLLAGALHLNFNDFFWLNGRPGMFFMVQLGAVAATAVLWLMFRKARGAAPASDPQILHSAIPLILLLALVAALALSSVVFPNWEHAAGWISLLFGALSAMWWVRRHKMKEFFRGAYKLDWGTGFFIIGVFIVVGGLTSSGLVATTVEAIAGFCGDNLFLTYSVLVWGSVALSAFIDNVPFVAAMLPICVSLAHRLGVPPELLAFGMMIGASVGGNITPIGASANIVSVGIARREGDEVSFWRFAKLGIPFTLAGTAVIYAVLWLLWR